MLEHRFFNKLLEEYKATTSVKAKTVLRDFAE